jgi:hypothetical protein
VEIGTGAYEIAPNEFSACELLRDRVPDAKIWLVRIGWRCLYRC